jgi:zinc transporter 1
MLTFAQLPGVRGVHELHVWCLDQWTTIASAHIMVECDSISKFSELAQQIGECLHDYGIHSFTLQPELFDSAVHIGGTNGSRGAARVMIASGREHGSLPEDERSHCRIKCRAGSCAQPQCCD